MNALLPALMAETYRWGGPLLCFWGHSGNGVGPWCLSQWHTSGFSVDGARYPTAEHWMMAQKATLFGDLAAAQDILSNPDPRSVKAIGRRIRGFDGAVWDNHKFSIVVEGNRHKFAQNPELGAYLRSTAPQPLVEASPFDAVWGVGLRADDPLVHSPPDWQGENLLGFALMVVRGELVRGE